MGLMTPWGGGGSVFLCFPPGANRLTVHHTTPGSSGGGDPLSSMRRGETLKEYRLFYTEGIWTWRTTSVNN